MVVKTPDGEGTGCEAGYGVGRLVGAKLDARRMLGGQWD